MMINQVLEKAVDDINQCLTKHPYALMYGDRVMTRIMQVREAMEALRQELAIPARRRGQTRP
jgi:anaerobic glycerol-3-phosphate dehydrogenase